MDLYNASPPAELCNDPYFIDVNKTYKHVFNRSDFLSHKSIYQNECPADKNKSS